MFVSSVGGKFCHEKPASLGFDQGWLAVSAGKKTHRTREVAVVWPKHCARGLVGHESGELGVVWPKKVRWKTPFSMPHIDKRENIYFRTCPHHSCFASTCLDQVQEDIASVWSDSEPYTPCSMAMATS
jgi:hypothetical protein